MLLKSAATVVCELSNAVGDHFYFEPQSGVLVAVAWTVFLSLLLLSQCWFGAFITDLGN